MSLCDLCPVAPCDHPCLEFLEAQRDYETFPEYECDYDENARRARIAAGIEHRCAGCGCSESLPCPGGCIWATSNLCSRCATPGRAIII